jgi:hypothetical protein
VWGEIWRLWPLFLILGGLQIIFGSTWLGSWLVGLVGLGLIIYIILFSVASTNPAFHERLQERYPWIPRSMMWQTSGNEQMQDFVIGADKYQGVTSRVVTADVGTGKMTVTDDESTNYFALAAQYFENFGKPRVRERQDGDKLLVDFDTEGGFAFFMMGTRGTSYDITLGRPELATDLTVEVGTGSTETTLDRLKVGVLKVTVGTGAATVDLASASIPAGDVSLDVGTGTMKLRLPKDVGLRITHDVGTGRLKIGDSTIDGDGTFVTEGYESAAKKLELDVEVGTGSMTIERI